MVLVLNSQKWNCSKYVGIADKNHQKSRFICTDLVSLVTVTLHSEGVQRATRGLQEGAHASSIISVSRDNYRRLLRAQARSCDSPENVPRYGPEFNGKFYLN